MITVCSFTFADLVKSFGPLITACVTILVFYLTTRRDKKKESKKNKVEKLNKVKYVNYIADDAIKLVNKQVVSLKEHIEGVKAQKFDTAPLVYYNKRSCELLSELMSSELTFSAFVATPMENQADIIQTYSKISAKAVFIDALFDLILKNTKDNFEYVHMQAKSIQTEIDGLLRAVNSLSLSLQRSGSTASVDLHFVAKVKALDENLYNQDIQGLETIYNFLIVPLKDVVTTCKTRDFHDVDALLIVARLRDRTERMYNELFVSHDNYLNTLDEQTTLLESECNELNALVSIVKPLKV